MMLDLWHEVELNAWETKHEQLIVIKMLQIFSLINAQLYSYISYSYIITITIVITQ